MSRRFHVLYADKAQGRTYRVRSYVSAESVDAARAIFASVNVVSVREVK